MIDNKKIDIIIPIYNTPNEILFECLSSIVIQSIKNDLKITIVDDASTIEDYQSVINIFSEFLDIQLLRLENNGGPGVARQYGIDHTKNDYIVFIDADDIFDNGFALEKLKIALENEPKNQVIGGNFLEVQRIEEDNAIYFFDHNENLVWVFGKIYKRAFLNKYNIRFHPTSRANEDTGFNTLCLLYANEEERIDFIQDSICFWRFNPNSITRKNNCEYGLSAKKDGSFYGYMENMIYAITTALNDKKIKDKQKVIRWAYRILVRAYTQYLEIYDSSDEENVSIALEHCKKYYTEVYSPLKELLSDDEKKKLYQKEIKPLYGFLPITPITFNSFLASLEE